MAGIKRSREFPCSARHEFHAGMCLAGSQADRSAATALQIQLASTDNGSRTAGNGVYIVPSFGPASAFGRNMSQRHAAQNAAS